jgi:hypothetical protein
MTYASFRCAVAAPISAIWKTLQQLHARGMGSDEEVFVDRDRLEIIIRWKKANSGLKGERRLAVRSHEHGAVLESILRWDADNEAQERELVDAHVEALVRDLALEVKKVAEAS